MAKTSTFTLGATAIEITRDPVGSNVVELLPKGNIQAVFAVKPQTIPAPPNDVYWIYKYPTITQIEILFFDDKRLNIELQDISNQPTWNTGTIGAMQTALAAINAWL